VGLRTHGSTRLREHRDALGGRAAPAARRAQHIRLLAIRDGLFPLADKTLANGVDDDRSRFIQRDLSAHGFAHCVPIARLAGPAHRGPRRHAYQAAFMRLDSHACRRKHYACAGKHGWPRP
jgi:hypothetical protein